MPRLFYRPPSLSLTTPLLPAFFLLWAFSSGKAGKKQWRVWGPQHLLPSSAAIRVLIGSSQATLAPLSRSWQLAVWSALPVLSDLLRPRCPACPHGLLFQLLSERSPVCECVVHTRF